MRMSASSAPCGQLIDNAETDPYRKARRLDDTDATPSRPKVAQAESALQLGSLVVGAIGSDVAATHLAWARALTRANPQIAEAFMAEELRKWALIAAATARV